MMTGVAHRDHPVRTSPATAGTKPNDTCLKRSTSPKKTAHYTFNFRIIHGLMSVSRVLDKIGIHVDLGLGYREQQVLFGGVRSADGVQELKTVIPVVDAN